MRTREDARVEPGRGDPGARLSFVDHDRQRYAAKVPLPNGGEVLVGEYLEGGGTGPLGEFKVALHDLGRRDGLLDPQLCVFGDGAAALVALLGLEGADLAGLLAPVLGHEAMSRRLLGLGLRDRSDASLAAGREDG
ncbi:MAG: hypothetical protein JST59_15145 [Actinobacteria bacterium]|nr:hypothetical protein [Actinomycetota bacterium]